MVHCPIKTLTRFEANIMDNTFVLKMKLRWSVNRQVLYIMLKARLLDRPLACMQGIGEHKETNTNNFLELLAVQEQLLSLFRKPFPLF